MFNLIRRSLVRLFGRPATSVPPKSEAAENPQLARLIDELTDFNAEIAAHKTALPPMSPIEGGIARTRMTGRTIAESHLRHSTDIMDAIRGPILDIHAEVTRRLDTLDIPEDTSPEAAQRMIEEALADLPVHIGGVIRPGDPRYDELTAQHEAQESVSRLRKAGPMPPVLDGINPDAMPWGVWAQWMAEVKAPAGWSACRFGARIGPVEGSLTGQMFGITRGDFGIFTREFYVCHPVHDDRVLAALIHLPTGTGVGMFMSTDMAVEGAELAMALGGVNWRSDIDPTAPEKWQGIRERMSAAWSAAGLRVAPFHAHDGEGEDEETPISIWMSTHHTRTAGKPKSFGDLS